MYDINFIMPICDLTKHYFRRFLDLKKYCMVNIGDLKVKIKLLTGPGEDFYGHDILEDWPDNLHAEQLVTPYLNPAQKIAYYYSKLTEEEVSSARWHAKFDDDTATDVTNLLRLLDEDFDYTDKIYLVTELRHELHGVEIGILNGMGHGHWVNNDRITHEWEGCINSQGSLLAAFKNDKAMHYFRERSRHPEGFGDQPVGIGMKFCKVPAVLPGYLTVWSRPSQFSLFGGPYSHVHFFLGRGDLHMRSWDFYKNLIDKNSPKNIKDKINNRMFSISKKDFWENIRVTLREDHRVIAPQGEEKGMWTIYKKDVVAVIFHDYPHLVLEFRTIDETFRNFSGVCIENRAPLSMKAVANI